MSTVPRTSLAQSSLTPCLLYGMRTSKSRDGNLQPRPQLGSWPHKATTEEPHLGQATEAPGSSIGPQGEVGSTEPLRWPDHSGQQKRQWPLSWLYRILLLPEDQDHKGDERWGEIG